jgi:hypothetical protein
MGKKITKVAFWNNDYTDPKRYEAKILYNFTINDMEFQMSQITKGTAKGLYVLHGEYSMFSRPCDGHTPESLQDLFCTYIKEMDKTMHDVVKLKSEIYGRVKKAQFLRDEAARKDENILAKRKREIGIN